MRANIIEETPETLTGAIRHFGGAATCHKFMVAMRWPDGVRCPHCDSTDIGKLVVVKKSRKGELLKVPRRVWNCKNCRKQFTVKVGTIFEDSPLGLEKWLPATWLIVNAKNGTSSCELARSLGVTQKTAWFMLHRIRLAMQDGSIEKMKGRVEADETFIGGKARYMHKDRRARTTRGQGGSVGKAAVMGLLERNTSEKHSRVRCKVLGGVRRRDIEAPVRQNVEKGAELYTDALPSYDKLADAYIHKVIDHAECYAKGHVHTNGLENFWSLLKRGIKGTYVSVEPFHLFRYLDEQAFRFNERKDDDKGRFLKTIANFAGKRLMYSKLIGQGGDGLPPQTTGTWQAA
ncbi:MAG TPA: IS1595 family transposase [Chthoniobacterales bacterium]|nr:IS1595 family transposase [Chthoniobacterales bacterium]